MQPKLSDDQLRAATSKAKLSYVRASPGSGKTAICVERFGWLKYHHLANDVRGIGAVSFARSASAELRSRIGARWGQDALSWPSQISTFDELHRLVLRFLVANDLIKWPGGKISLELFDSWRRFPNTRQRGLGIPLGVVVDKQGWIDVDELGSWPRPSVYFVDREPYLEELQKGNCTHDEVRSILYSVLVNRQPDLSAEVVAFFRRTFAHLIVDEVFDLNGLDTELLRLAVNADVGLTLVGDPWQCIFEWRGSTPRLVDELINASPFWQIPIVGSHRYRTSEMRDLVSSLASGGEFQVLEADSFRIPDVVLADRWMTLWETTSLPILPAGLGRIDATGASAALLLLLNDLTSELFDTPAADLANALANLNRPVDHRQMVRARNAVANPSAGISEVWAALYEGLERPPSWGTPKRISAQRLSSIMALIRSRRPLILGTSVHQAKGLEWPLVDYVTDLLPTLPRRLDPTSPADRQKYVALTRAQHSVRVRPLPRGTLRQMRFELRIGN